MSYNIALSICFLFLLSCSSIGNYQRWEESSVQDKETLKLIDNFYQCNIKNKSFLYEVTISHKTLLKSQYSNFLLAVRYKNNKLTLAGFSKVAMQQLFKIIEDSNGAFYYNMQSQDKIYFSNIGQALSFLLGVNITKRDLISLLMLNYRFMNMSRKPILLRSNRSGISFKINNLIISGFTGNLMEKIYVLTNSSLQTRQIVKSIINIQKVIKEGSCIFLQDGLIEYNRNNIKQTIKLRLLKIR